MDILELMVACAACAGVLGFAGSLCFAGYRFGYSRGQAASHE